MTAGVPRDDVAGRFGTHCPVCGSALGDTEPRVDADTGRFTQSPSFRLEVDDSGGQGPAGWRVTMLAGNYPPAESTDPPFNPHSVDYVYLLCGDGHIFPDATPAFLGGTQRHRDVRQRVDDFNVVATVGSPASGKTYLLIRTLHQNLDMRGSWHAERDPARIRARELSPLEKLPTRTWTDRYDMTRKDGTAIHPSGTESAAYPFGIMQRRFPRALNAIQAMVRKVVLDGGRRADNWGKGFRQPLVLRTDSGGFRTWTGIADLPGELFTEDGVNRRELRMLRSFDALVWVLDPPVAHSSRRWMRLVADPDLDESLQLGGNLRPGTVDKSSADTVRVNREAIQNRIGEKITVIDGPLADAEGRPLQMLVTISKCDLIRAALRKGCGLTGLGAAGDVMAGAATYLGFTLNRWSAGRTTPDAGAGQLLHYLLGARHAPEAGRRRRVEQIAAGLIRHYSDDTEFWNLVHDGAETKVSIPAGSIAEHPQSLRIPSLDEHLDSARRPGSDGHLLLRDLVMSTIGCGIAFALGQRDALNSMHQEAWLTMRYFLCSPLTTVPVAKNDEQLRPRDPDDCFPPINERAAGLTQLLLAILERARR
ncbi:hypothetical protein Acy02nite_73720 [Actinoplanes cyaneus]|uniref:Uncharacterized protein n=1 Tax=Actinoplanes cyaneus TaxID=52696 RepID=A0A919IR46_9ACTN|nr:hypothetical protein [Actinoplanes cyaneus]MCW2135510.1 hypothetical protein [Actinoplanes cyaneus]GID69491.1 hypothetical protein Acy02nite_73720 [Actinoplanes cyaneus]